MFTTTCVIESNIFNGTLFITHFFLVTFNAKKRKTSDRFDSKLFTICTYKYKSKKLHWEMSFDKMQMRNDFFSNPIRLIPIDGICIYCIHWRRICCMSFTNMCGMRIEFSFFVFISTECTHDINADRHAVRVYSILQCIGNPFSQNEISFEYFYFFLRKW